MRSSAIRRGRSAALAASATATAMSFFLAVPAFAQDAEDQPAIVVTGTRQADRSAADTVAPVDVVSGAELTNTADSDVGNALRISVPSFNVSTQPISDAATLVRPANLRGLSPDNTLVLVNGKRMHRASVIAFLGGGISDGSQGPDISVIPSIALKQLEVLRDGASSQYGSDAIAGVLNFILKDSPEGGELSAKWGQTYEGDGDNWQIAGNIGLPLGDRGFINLSAEYGESDATDRSVQRDDAAALIAAGNTAVANPAQIWGQPNVRDDLKLYVNTGFDLTDEIKWYAFGNYASRKVDGGFFFRNPTNRGGVFAGPMVDPVTGMASSAANAVPSVLVGDMSNTTAGDCPAGIPLTQGGGLIPNPTILALVKASANCFSFVEMFPGGFTPRFGGTVRDWSAATGVKGKLFGGLDFDLSYRHGDNKSTFSIRNTINASLGPNTPTTFSPGSYQQSENVVDLSLGHEFALGTASVYVAAGGQYRDETFKIFAGDPESYALGPLAQPTAAYPTGQGFSTSSNGFPGFAPNSAGSWTEDNKAAYLDVEADLVEALTVQGAVRYESTKSFGDTTTWKLGALYKLTEALRVRGTYSTGFHVPTAGQANVINVTTQFSNGALQDEGTFPLSSAPGVIAADYIADTVANGGLGLPRPTLGPEKSKSFTAGLAGDFGDISFTLDYFNIKLENRISRSSSIDFPLALCYLADREGVANNCTATFTPRTAELLTQLDNANVIDRADFTGFEDLVAFSFFNNDFSTRTQGIDFVTNARLRLTESGTTRATLALNYTKTKVTDAGATIASTRLRQLEEGLPRWKGFFNLTHDQGRFRSLLRVNYFGKYFEAHLEDDTLPIDAKAKITVDAELGYELFDGLELAVGAQNLFDTYPTVNPWGGIVGAQYGERSPFGFNGGSYYARARFKF
ncbi:iron complex outermembrane receptor protein [Novosphingobium kunmingense]|uniref:Iron complex outermembrane receptor protein n=1 Tax=Novosphingobium kunmingense TaxID=1211806 RepID=A0A2N0HJW0_9SPHN|nr:TonB-dependent receptor [Novosphingobium kunmingense]PKB19155.1 iron complex outermembrane receptor protein [Novosphingobium kunmingense]